MMVNEVKTETDPLEKLLQYAGRREAVDRRRAQRVEEHLFSRWRDLVRERRMRQRRRRVKMIGGGLALAAGVAMVVVILLPGVTPAPIVAEVERSVGTVLGGERGEPLTDLLTGSILHAGGVLETAGTGGAGLKLKSGHSLRVSASSRLRLEVDRILLDRGRVYLDSGAAGSPQSVAVHSSYGAVREVGTQYQVQLLPNGIEVSVREGLVHVDRRGNTLTARAGEALRLDDGGLYDREEIPIHGERWQWVTELSPTLDIDGRTVAQVLDWLSRENGWRIRYASAEIERRAHVTQLNGSIDGLDAEDALATVMITTGWNYVLGDGLVVIGDDDTGTGQ